VGEFEKIQTAFLYGGILTTNQNQLTHCGEGVCFSTALKMVRKFSYLDFQRINPGDASVGKSWKSGRELTDGSVVTRQQTIKINGVPYSRDRPKTRVSVTMPTVRWVTMPGQRKANDWSRFMKESDTMKTMVQTYMADSRYKPDAYLVASRQKNQGKEKHKSSGKTRRWWDNHGQPVLYV
jgi:hypothetical protein